MSNPCSTNTFASESSTHDRNFDTRSETNDRDEGDHIELGAQTSGNQTRELSNETGNFNSRHPVPRQRPCVDQTSCCMSNEDKECVMCDTSDVPVYHIKMEQLDTLKNSTKKLLCLLEEVQAKTHSSALFPDDSPPLSSVLRPITNWDPEKCDNLMDESVRDLVGSAALKRLEIQTKGLDSIYIKDDDDDCSIYKRLTRKCHCLNQQEYNDFVMHFNEETKYCTNAIGEIIKNMRIMKKFLYMGGKYTKNALLFLNQGLDEGTTLEKSEIIQACAFADICCIFDTHSIVTVCISWPCKSPGFVESVVKEMTAEFLHSLAKLEEGRRYLNFNSKILCDIKKVLKKKHDKITYNSIELLTSVLTLCQSPTKRFGMNSLTYHCKPMQEAIGNKTLNALVAYHRFMGQNELFLHLDILLSLSSNETTKLELTPHLPTMLNLFKNMLIEYNNSEMNTVITNIMNNIVGNSEAYAKSKEKTSSDKERLTSCIATEPIKQRNETTQVPYAPKRFQKKSHHTRNRSHRPIIVKQNKHDKHVTTEKPQQPVQAKPNVLAVYQESNAAPVVLNASKTRKPSSAGSNVSRTRKLEPAVQQLKESAVYKRTEQVYAATNRPRKFMGGDIRTVIVVPMDQNMVK